MAFDPNQYKIKPANFDVNKYKQVDQQMFGPKAFDFSNVQKTVQMQAQADALQKQFMSLYQQRLHPPKPKKPKVEKKTYQDAVDYISANKDQFLGTQAPPPHIKFHDPIDTSNKTGAYRIADEIRNDPAKQAQIKAQGYNVTDYINALYNALSGGRFRSEREYNQYVGKLTKDIQARDKAYKDKHGMTQDQAYALQKQTEKQQQAKSNGNSFLDILGNVKNQVERNTANVINSAGLDIPNWLAEHTPKVLKNVNFPIAPGINVSANSLIKSQKPSTTTSGKVMDTLSNLAGYAVPGELAVKGAKLLKAGKGVEKGLQALGAGSKVAKIGGIGAEGAIAGGLFGAGQQGVDAALHPNSQTLKQRLTNVAIDTGLGAIGDPLFHVGGTALGKFLGKVKASKQELNSVVSNLKLPKELRAQALKVKDVNNGGQNPFNVLNNPLKGVDVKTGGYKSMPRTESSFKTNVVKDDAYYNEYVDALDNQVSLLKSQMGQGVQQGGVVRDVNGDVVNRFGRVSNNPQWYQELFKELGHTPNNEDLYTLAAEQLKNGYVDNGIQIPPWGPKNVSGIHEEINNLENIIANERKSVADLSKPKRPYEMSKKEFESLGPNGDYSANSPSPLEAQKERLSGRYDKYLLTDKNLSNPNFLSDVLGLEDKYPVSPDVLKGDFVKVYRTVPDNVDMIKPGDYVSLSKDYVEAYKNGGWKVDRNHTPPTKILTSELPKSDLVLLGANELTWAPKDAYKAMLDLAERQGLKGKNKEIDTNILGKKEFELQGLERVLNDLKTAKKTALQPQTKITINAIPKENPLAKIQKQVAATKQVENISPETGKLHKLTKTEQYHMNNQDTFANNNRDKSIPDTSNHIMSKKDVKPSTSGLLDKAQVKLVDNLKPLDWFDKTVEKVTGKKLRPSESSYTLGLNSRGSDMISKQILTKNMVDSKGNVIGKSLKDITKELDPKTLKSFEDYLVNKHAITRMNRGEKVFPDSMKMSPQKSEQIVKAYEEKYPKFKDLSKSYYEYNKQLGKSWLVDTGILSKDEWQGYLKANPNYVPNNRIFQDIERHMNQSAKRGFANQSKPPKKAVGSQRKIVSPIESTIEHTAQYVKTAKRNEVMQTLIKNIQKDPEAFKGWAEVVNTDKTSVKETLNKEGIDGVLENINNGFEQKPDLTKGNFVTGIIDGNKVHVKVDDPQLLEALTNLNPKQQHFVVKLFGQMTRVMKNLTTGINPVFSLTRNVFRDIPQSYSNSKSVDNPAKFSKDLVSAFLDVLGNREAYQSFKNFGGGHSSPISSDVNLLAQSKRDILAPKNGVLSTPKRVGGKLLGGLENLNNAVESAPRLAEFKRIAKNGSYDSKVKALYEANDITTNFNKYGDTTKFLDAFVPYLNAAVQGLDKLGRQFFTDGKKGAIRTGVKASAAVTLPAIVLYAINHDNPNYKQLSNYIKDQNFLIPTGNGQFIKIPKPRELGVMFGSDVERTLRAWADKDPHAFEGFTEYIKQMFWPPTRPITAPISDIRANKNFMDTPIVPGDLKNLSPKYQYDSQTSEVAKKLGGLFNQSPKNIDYLFKSYGGVLGQLGIPATTKNSTIGNTLKKQVTADPVFSNDILSHFYDEKTKLDTARNDFKKQGVKTKDFNESLRSVFDSRANAISDLRKRMKKAMNNDSLTRNQREQQVRQIQQQINAIAKQTNQLVR